MKKRSAWKIGHIHSKPFPVVYVRFRPVDEGYHEVCAVDPCQSLEFFPSPPRATFHAQLSIDVWGISDLGLSEKERGEILWEKAYRDQLAGKELEPTGYPVCAQCAAWVMMTFFRHEDEEQAATLLAASLSTGRDIILFDRNLSRGATYPSATVGRFDTLADFRRAYWQTISA